MFEQVSIFTREGRLMAPTIHVESVIDGTAHGNRSAIWNDARSDRERGHRYSLQAVPVEGLLPEPASVEELQLVQRLFFLCGKERTPRTVVFCGVEPKDCAEVVCARTAEILAGLVKDPICLMDANLRSPTLHLRYQLGGIVGTSLAREEARSQTPEYNHDPNLWVLPAATLKNDTPGLVPDLVREQFTRLRERFGFLLICAPPLGTEPEGLLLGQMADGIILTVLANSTRKATAHKVRRSLDLYNIRVLGAVVNQFV
jgi:hypothetical protein